MTPVFFLKIKIFFAVKQTQMCGLDPSLGSRRVSFTVRRRCKLMYDRIFAVGARSSLAERESTTGRARLMDTLEVPLTGHACPDIQHFPFRGSQPLFWLNRSFSETKESDWKKFAFAECHFTLFKSHYVRIYANKLEFQLVALKGPRDRSTCPLSSNKQALV